MNSFTITAQLKVLKIMYLQFQFSDFLLVRLQSIIIYYNHKHVSF